MAADKSALSYGCDERCTDKLYLNRESSRTSAENAEYSDSFERGLALRELELTIAAREKVGICGRTGRQAPLTQSCKDKTNVLHIVVKPLCFSSSSAYSILFQGRIRFLQSMAHPLVASADRRFATASSFSHKSLSSSQTAIHSRKL